MADKRIERAPLPSEPGKLFVKSYGCQMNAYDAQRMADVLAPQGYVETTEMAEADIVVLNTCHIREKAAEKVYSELGRVRDLKLERASRGLDTKIVVAGCVAQAEGAEIRRRQPAVDVVVGPQAYHRLPELIAAANLHAFGLDTEFPDEDKFTHLPAPARARIVARGVTAFVTVQEGCDKFCAFCVVPYTRGAEVSRSADAVLAEVRRLAEAGVREVTLIGQNVNAWHGAGTDGGGSKGGTWGLARLMRAVAEVPGIARIRYTTSHPNDMDADLIAAHRDLPALMPYLHLPVQAGSDRILKAMNRRHTRDEYLRLIEKVRAARPDIALSSDFIVGFPGEDEADFADTLALAEEVGFASFYAFKYSERPGTPAADRPDQVPEDEKSERLARLMAVLEPQRQAWQAAQVGRVTDVLVEKPGRHPGQMTGKTPWLNTVQIESRQNESATGANLAPGRIVTVEIVAASTNSLFGRPLETQAASAA